MAWKLLHRVFHRVSETPFEVTFAPPNEFYSERPSERTSTPLSETNYEMASTTIATNPFQKCCVIFYITHLILRSDKFREHTTSFFFVYGNSNHLASSPQYSHQTIMRLKVMCLSTSLIRTMELIFTEEIV